MNKILTCFFFLSIVQLSWEINSPFEYCSYEGEELDQNRYIPHRKGTAEMTLHQVQSLMRHGARTPASHSANSCFPKMREDPIEWDCVYYEEFSGSNKENNENLTHNFKQFFDAQPNQSVLLGNCRQGQLTIDAIPQIKAVANSFYNAYFNENPIFNLGQLKENPELLYLRSTDVQRTRHTNAGVITNLLSMMEKSQGTKFNGDLVIHLVDEENDEMKGDVRFCENFESIIHELIQDPEYHKLVTEHKAIYDEVKALQTDPMNPMWFWNTLDCYMSLLCHKKQDYLPESFKLDEKSGPDSFGYKLYDVFEKENAYFTLGHDSALSRCISKQFVKNFLSGLDVPESVDNPNHGPRNSKFTLYSAHDSTFVYFLSSIKNLYDKKWPSYASMFIFEIYKNKSDKNYFRIIYNGNDVTDRIDGCQSSSEFISEGVCPFEMFMKATDWIHTEEPTVKIVQQKEGASLSTIAIFILLFIAGFALGILSINFFNYIKARKSNSKAIYLQYITEKV